MLTSHHVVAGADDIQLVLADGRVLKARLTGTDPESDLAVLKADATGLPSITFGTLEHVEVGDPVLAIGNAYGLGHTVTSGIVSALGRTSLDITRYEDFIQTDAPINPGNSGGALVDANGSLIGINSAIYSQSGGSVGIGFAVPVTLARSVLEQIIQTGEVTRGWLGVEPQDVTAEVARALALDRADGVLIRSVQRGGPADAAGIAPRDVVVEIAGKPTRDTPTLLARIAELRPGSTVKLTYDGDGVRSSSWLDLAEAGIQRIAFSDPDAGRVAALMDLARTARVDDRISAGTVDDLGAVDLAVNASPVGMNGEDRMPFDPARLPRHAMVADVVTKPVETPLLRAAKAHGCRIQTGLEMSDAQATMQLDFFGLLPADGAP